MEKQKRDIIDFVKKAYFDMKVDDQGKSWAPHVIVKPVLKLFVVGQTANLNFNLLYH